MKNVISFFARHKAWFFRLILITLILASPFYGESILSYYKNNKTSQNPVFANIANFFSKKNSPPTESNYFIDPKEDQALLEKTLKTIFPNGTEGLSEEEKSIAVMQFVTVFLKHQNNTGTATKILNDGYAICGGKAYVFRILMRKLGLASRYIGVHYIPGQGGHDMAEVYYNQSWHLFDPTFGLFVYSQKTYNQKGKILSMDDLRSNSEQGFIQQTVAEPWTGNYSAQIRQTVINPLKKDFLPEYGNDFNHYWRSDIANAFPVAYGVDSWISIPVDIDLTQKTSYQIGQKDNSHIDVSMHEKRFEGYGVLGKSQDTPGVYNTWIVKAAPQSEIRIRYWASKPAFADINFIALRSARLQQTSRGLDYFDLTIKTFDDPAIFITITPNGTFVIDAIEIEKIK